MDITIKYDGSYPNLCSGNLTVIIEDKKHGKKEIEFPSYCLSSCGSVSFDDDWNENISEGEWSIEKWPKDFPEELKKSVLAAVNEQIEHGCYGGCV